MRSTESDRPIPTIPPEAARVLYDATKRVAYALAMEIVEELRRDPSRAGYARQWLLANPLAFSVDQEAWMALLAGPVEVLASELLRTDGTGELLRDTMPSFGAIDEPRRLAIARAARNAHA